MAGHSKWANIKHRKGAADAKRGKIFNKVAKDILIAARSGGGDPNANPSLRGVIQKAKAANMPADRIDKAIKKGTGELDDGTVLEEMMYEGFAPGGVALIVQVLSDNRNRSAAEVRHCFTKGNASLATQGSVSRSFQRKGLISVPAEGLEEETLMELALEAGAEDFEEDGEFYSITTDPGQLMTVVDALTAKEIPIDNSEVSLLPDTYVKVDDPAQGAAIMKFLEALEDLDDVQNVYSNLDIDDEIMAALEEA